jgi:hydrogenase maturation protease
MSARPRVLVIGIGNAYRSDDAVGLFVAEKIGQQGLQDVRVAIESGEGAALMERFQEADLVVLVDAVQSGGQPGTLYRLDACERAVPAPFFRYSTHNFSVAEAVEMARALGQLPRQLVIYGIEGASFKTGVGLSPEVERAAGELIDRLLGEISAGH